MLTYAFPLQSATKVPKVYRTNLVGIPALGLNYFICPKLPKVPKTSLLWVLNYFICPKLEANQFWLVNLPILVGKLRVLPEARSSGYLGS